MSNVESHPAFLPVCLRDVEPADLPLLFEHQSDPESNRMAVVNPRDAAAFDAHWARILGDASLVAKAILVDGKLAGQISCFKLDGLDAVGYWIGRDYWGKGVATRALGLLLEQVPIRPLYARAARSNLASIRVLQRCGFAITGYELSPATDRFPACEEAMLIVR